MSKESATKRYTYRLRPELFASATYRAHQSFSRHARSFVRNHPKVPKHDPTRTRSHYNAPNLECCPVQPSKYIHTCTRVLSQVCPLSRGGSRRPTLYSLQTKDPCSGVSPSAVVATVHTNRRLPSSQLSPSSSLVSFTAVSRLPSPAVKCPPTLTSHIPGNVSAFLFFVFPSTTGEV